MVAQQSVHDRLASSELPPNAANSAQFLRALMDPDQGLAELAAVVQLHAIIVGKIIALANSAWSNPVASVTALDEACSRLGLDIVRTLSIALAVGRSFALTKCPTFDLKRHWMSSVITSDIAARLALDLELNSGSARTAGLLHNIGLLWLADQAPAETNAAFQLSQESSDIGVDALLQQHCGIGYRDAGALLLAKWDLPDELIPSFVPSAGANSKQAGNKMTELILTSANLASEVLTENKEPSGDWPLANLDSQRLADEITHQLSCLPQTERIAAALVAP